MEQIAKKIDLITKKLNEDATTPQGNNIVDSLEVLAETLGGIPAKSNSIVEQLEVIAENVNGGGIIPDGSLTITKDGLTDVTVLESVDVNVTPKPVSLLADNIIGTISEGTVWAYGLTRPTYALTRKYFSNNARSIEVVPQKWRDKYVIAVQAITTSYYVKNIVVDDEVTYERDQYYPIVYFYFEGDSVEHSHIINFDIEFIN